MSDSSQKPGPKLKKQKFRSKYKKWSLIGVYYILFFYVMCIILKNIYLYITNNVNIRLYDKTTPKRNPDPDFGFFWPTPGAEYP